MKFVWIYTLLAMLSALMGCSSGTDTKYLEASSSARLAIPPDLTQATLNEKFEIPAGFSSGIDESVNNIPVLAQVDSLRLEGREDFYWLALDGSIDNLYQLIKSFWAAEGFVISVDEPVLGMMQTQWVIKKEGTEEQDRSFFLSLFLDSRLTTGQDQYRTRIARDDYTGVTRIYISHRGTRSQPIKKVDPDDPYIPDAWIFRPPEPELEVEMLSRLMIFLGLEQADVDQQLADIKLFASRASIHIDNAENTTYLLVKAIKKQTWNRVMHELDRLNIEVIASDYNVGLSGDGEILIKSDFEVETKKSGFFSFFLDETEMVNRVVRLVLSEQSHELTRIGIKTRGGDVNTSPEAAEFLAILHKRIK
ncbi:MAG: outer membrane protein assembly factor BamC [Gammaproteobacteria bacterium]|nr:outer membrane protein assembly factor BamC [Gammaproteobacteria bacterium]